jgi:hypothetical protein
MDRGDALTPDEATVLRSINLAFAETSGWHLGKLIELAQRGARTERAAYCGVNCISWTVLPPMNSAEFR